MKFKVLQDNLRKMLWERIEAGDLTGLRLAQQTGFKQAHISNFLNKKRGLSLEGMDKVLVVQHLSVLDLLEPSDVSKRATILPPSDDEFENVLLVDPSAAATEPMVVNEHVHQILKFKKTFLEKLRPEMEGKRNSEDWQRFVLIKADAEEALSMHPRLEPGSMLLIDRHYNSLKPYREGAFNLYAVLKRNTCIIRYVEAVGDHLILRPHNPSSPIELMAMEDGTSAPDYLIGRICHISIEA
jgi:hypothetical protein